jgi:putative peptidoglycan lipid II flippase
MVEKFFKVFHKEIRGLHEAAYLLAIFSLVSQVLGLLRDRIFAGTFGAGATLDTYYAAFKIPDFLYVTIASLVSISVLVPYLVSRDKKSEREFLSKIFSVYILLVLAMTLGAFFLAPYLLPKLFPALWLSRGGELLLLTRVLLLSPILLGVSNFLAGITQAHKRFFLYALSPVFYNAGIIAGVLFFYPLWGVVGLACGVVLGALLHMAVHVPYVIKAGLFPRLYAFENPKDFVGEVGAVFKVSVPRTLALAASSLALLYLNALASRAGDGAVSVFNFAFNLQSIPLSLIGISYSLAAFPLLSEFWQQEKYREFEQSLFGVLKHIIFWSMPIIFSFVVLRAHMVRLAFGSSASFDWTDTRLTAACFALFSISAIAQSFVVVLVRAMYATGKTLVPFMVNLVGFVTMTFGSYFLYKFYASSPEAFEWLFRALRISAIPGKEVIIAVLGYSLGTSVIALLLYRKMVALLPIREVYLRTTVLQSFLASFLAGYFIYGGLQVSASWFDQNTGVGIAKQFLFAGGIGFGVWVGVLVVLGNQEIREAIASLRLKLFKRKIAPIDDVTIR